MRIKNLPTQITLSVWVVLCLVTGFSGNAGAQTIEANEWKTLSGHQSKVTSVAFSPDGKLLVSGSEDKKIRLWSVETGRAIRTIQGHSKPIRSVAFSQGQLLASGAADKKIKLWSVQTEKEIRTFSGHSKEVESIAFSPDGTLLASGSTDNTIRLWSVETGKKIKTFSGHSRDIKAVAFSPDGTLLASGAADKKIKLWSVEARKEIRTLGEHSDDVSAIAFSPDGKLLASASDDKTIRLWSVETGEKIRTFIGHSKAVASVAFSPDGILLASASADKTIKLWKLEIDTTPPELSIIEPHVTRGIQVTSKEKEIIVRGKAADPSGISEVTVNGLKANVAASGEFSAPINLAVGENRIKVRATDQHNNVAEEPFTIVHESIDDAGPTITIVEPSVVRGFRVISREEEIVVRGKATAPSGISNVTVNRGEASVVANGEFRTVIRLTYGENRITVRATDTKGNATSEIFTIVREGPSPSSPQQAGLLSGEYHALIIAVKDYTSPTVSDLDFPIQDAESIMDLLTTAYTFDPENVHFLKNPNRKTILKKLRALKDELTEDDNLLIFYSGHGYWDEDFRQGYWLPRDANANDTSEWLSNSTIRDYIRGIKTRHTLLISDACFSGGIFKTRDAFTKPDASIEKVYEIPSRKAITSGALKTVPDRSVFLEYLVKNLTRNREKYLYAGKLYFDMKPAVINNSPVNQTPLYGTIQGAGDEGGDFIFIRR